MSCIITLKKKGLKLTPQRRLIADILHDNKDNLTAEEIIAYVQSRMKGVNKSTVYRNLELLEEAGCVYKSDMGDKRIYHHAEEGHHHHHHLVCNSCGKTIDCDEDLFKSLERSLCRKYGFDINLKHMVLEGLCEECKKKK